MSNPNSFVLTDGEVADLMQAGAVNRYNQTGDVQQLPDDAFYQGTEEMEKVMALMNWMLVF